MFSNLVGQLGSVCCSLGFMTCLEEMLNPGGFYHTRNNGSWSIC